MRKSLFKVIGAVVLAASFGAAWLWMDFNTFIDTPLNIGEEGIYYEITPGMTLTAISRDLAKRGVLDKPRYLRWLARWQGSANIIKTGEYEFAQGTTPTGLLDKIVNGKVVQYSLTIVEGWTFRQLMDAVRSHKQIVQTLAGVKDDKIMEKLGYPRKHPEGMFFPDTYFFPKQTTDVEFLQRAYQAMQTILKEEWERRVGALPYKKPYDALIMASVVEKETAVPEERQPIAGVFIRRLERGMRLQTDPTVIYALGDKYDGNIRRRDLRLDSPYNTYRYKGLPPTPIAMPGRDAIHAALHPDASGALYFVARGDGSHEFSETLDQHNKAVIKYQLNGRKRKFSSN
jgi:UPF0755 protein